MRGPSWPDFSSRWIADIRPEKPAPITAMLGWSAVMGSAWRPAADRRADGDGVLAAAALVPNRQVAVHHGQLFQNIKPLASRLFRAFSASPPNIAIWRTLPDHSLMPAAGSSSIS